MTFWNSYKNVGDQESESVSYNYAARIYIGSHTSERFIELPAFITELKYDLQKEVEAVEEKDKTGTRYIQKVSTVSLTLNLDVPAASAEEGKHNLIRISEIMRMISPSSVNAKGEPTPAQAPKIYILFSNLICRGNLKTPSFIKKDKFSTLKKHGLPCYIKDFEYNPDVEAGFFMDPDYRTPRNIKVNIAASIETIPWDATGEGSLNLASQKIGEASKFTTSAYVMRGLSVTGDYMVGDSGGFPFGMSVKDSRHPNKDYSFEQMNEYDSGYADATKSYFVIGNKWVKKKGKRKEIKASHGEVLGFQKKDLWTVPVYCRFKMFLEDYKFTKKTGLEPIKTADSDVGVVYKNYSDSNSEFKVSFSVIADSLEQAKKECAKIQVLFRLLFVQNDWDDATEGFLYTATTRPVYMPDLLENHQSDKTISNNYSKLYKNAVSCTITNISADIIHDLGYFMEEEDSKKSYYPKGFKVSVGGHTMGAGTNNVYAGRPGNYSKATGVLERNDYVGIINFPFKFK